MDQTDTQLDYGKKAAKRIQDLRNSLWDIAHKIFTLDPDELKILEKELRQQSTIPINDASIIRISEIVRMYHKEITALEKRSRMARITAMHPMATKRDMTPEAVGSKNISPDKKEVA